MVKLIFLVVAGCVAAIAAYDFKDSDFNEVIMRDFMELTDEDHHQQRSVRSADEAAGEGCKSGRKDRGFRCCNDKIDFKHIEVIKLFKKSCLEELHGNDSEAFFSFDPFTCDKLEEIKSDVICVAECVGRKFAMLDDEGNIKRDVFLEHMKIKNSDAEWKLKVTESIVDKCIAEAKNGDVMHIAKRDVAKKCNPASLRVTHCLWREFVKACPKDLQTESSKCNKLREKIERGDAVHYKGFFLRHFNDDK